MQPTDSLDTYQLLCVDITGIDLSKDEPAMLALVARVGTALRFMRKGKAKATDNLRQTHNSDSRKLVHIDVADIDFANDESNSIVDTLFRRLRTALMLMAKGETMASEELSLEDTTQSAECGVYLEAAEPSKAIDSGDSATSSPILGPFSGPWQDPQHFLTSWENALDAYEGDSEIYELRNDNSKTHGYNEDTSAAIKTFKDSNIEPGKTYGVWRKNGKVMK
jgi:hypothetical protein